MFLTNWTTEEKYLRYRKTARCRRENGEWMNCIFLNYEAGGTEEEVDKGIYVCDVAGVIDRYFECEAL